MPFSDEYEKLKLAVEKQHKVIKRKQELLDREREKLKKIIINCSHEEVEQKSSYFSGSYYDKACTTYWNQCKLCGTKSEEWDDTHSYYG